VTFARALGWFWLGHAAAAVAAFVWFASELASIVARYNLARDGLAQIAAFFAAYGMFVAVTLAVLGWKLGRFALGRVAGSALAFIAGVVVFQLPPIAIAWLGAFGLGPPFIARATHALVLFEAAVALVTLGWLATLRRAA
jgi:hypothetical protein